MPPRPCAWGWSTAWCQLPSWTPRLRALPRLLAGPRDAYAEIKRLVAESHDAALESQLQSEAEAFARCTAAADFGEGINAFFDKRTPAFRAD